MFIFWNSSVYAKSHTHLVFVSPAPSSDYLFFVITWELDDLWMINDGCVISKQFGLKNLAKSARCKCILQMAPQARATTKRLVHKHSLRSWYSKIWQYLSQGIRVIVCVCWHEVDEALQPPYQQPKASSCLATIHSRYQQWRSQEFDFGGLYVLTSPCSFKTCVNVPHVNKTVTDFLGVYIPIYPRRYVPGYQPNNHQPTTSA